MTAKYSKHCQSCVRPNSHTHTHKSKRMHSLFHTTHTHHEPKSMMLFCRQQIWRDRDGGTEKKSIYDTQCSVFCVYHVPVFLTGTLNQTFACVLLGRQYEPLTSRMMTGVTWGHRLPYNGAVIRGSTCAVAVSDDDGEAENDPSSCRVRVSLQPGCRVATTQASWGRIDADSSSRMQRFTVGPRREGLI